MSVWNIFEFNDTSLTFEYEGIFGTFQTLKVYEEENELSEDIMTHIKHICLDNLINRTIAEYEISKATKLVGLMVL